MNIKLWTMCDTQLWKTEVLRRLGVIALLVVGSLSTFGQTELQQFPEEYDELFVFLNIEAWGTEEMDAIYAEDEIYLPVLQLFKLLKIYTAGESKLEKIYGYIGQEDATYSFDFESAVFSFKDKNIQGSRADFLNTYGDVYIKAKLLEELFGFHFKLDFRSITLYLTTGNELPVVKILRQKKLRENLDQLQTGSKVDSVISQKRHVLKGAILDLNLLSTQKNLGSSQEQLRSTLATEFLGGDLRLRSIWNRGQKLNPSQQTFHWKYNNDRSKMVKQVQAGFIGVPMNSQVTTPLLGLGISNSPFGYRKSFGSILVERTTKPNWEVELFINNVLIGIATADANGYVKLEAPLMYGNNVLTIRYYGPYGEEEIEEKVVNIPFVFVPKNKIEYQINSGISADSSAHQFAHAKLAYGINEHITINASYEYFERNVFSRHIPVIGASIVVNEHLLFNIRSATRASHKASFLYRSNQGLFIQGESTFYEKSQDAELHINTQEHFLSLNLPLKIKDQSFMIRGRYRNTQNPFVQTHFTEIFLSTYLGRFNISGNVGGMITENPSTYFGLSSSLFLPRQWSCQASIQGDVNSMNINTIQTQFQKRFNQGISMNVNAQFGQSIEQTSVSIGVIFNLKKISAVSEVSHANNQIVSRQQLSSSILLGPAPHRLQATRRSNIGRGTVEVSAYLDVNHNNVKDANEPLVSDLDISMNRGIKAQTGNDSIHRFNQLELNTRHILSISENGIKNISWRLPNKVFAVEVDPNSVKRIYIPILPMSEIEGRVFMMDSTNRKIPFAGVLIDVVREDGSILTQIRPDRQAYFYSTELVPGKYTLKISQDPSKNSEWEQTQEYSFEILPSQDGEFLSDISLILQRTLESDHQEDIQH